MSFLKLKVPPALVFLVFGALLWAVSIYIPSLNISFEWNRWLPGFSAISGVLTIFAGLREFQRAATTTDPMHPDSASSTVRSGIYRFTRNPIYLGMLLLLAAFAIKYLNILSPLLLIGFVLYMTLFQIIPEEKALTEKFGNDYLEYKRSVRRWI